MKLLFDQNLSPRLAAAPAGLFPDSIHVMACGLDRVSDQSVWEYARGNGFTLVTKDSDFQELSLMQGAPPKVVWLRVGNCSTAHIEQVLRRHAEDIKDMADNAEVDCLLLYGP